MRIPRTPEQVDIDITNKCNLRCKYCYHFDSPGDVEEDLEFEEWQTFIREMGRCAVLNVTLCGGEPFCRKDLPSIIEEIVKNRMRFDILSNGTLITDEMAAFLADTHRCASIQVSIDGATAAAHDTVRGTGSLEKAIMGIETLQRHSIPALVRVTIHRHNLAELENVARLLLEDLGLPQFSTNSISQFGLCRKNNADLGLSVEEYGQAMEILLALEKKYEGRVTALAGPLDSAHHWREMLQAHTEGASKRGGGYLSSCGGVFKGLAVRADGVMTPCTQMPHIELGRINRDSLERLWQTHPELLRLRHRQKTPLTEMAFCRDCDFATLCSGGCPAVAHSLSGSDNAPSLDSCLRMFLESGGQMPKQQIGKAYVG